MTFDEDWKFIPRDGEKYVFIENVTSSVVPGSVNVNITNLFGGNKLLGKTHNIQGFSQLHIQNIYLSKST